MKQKAFSLVEIMVASVIFVIAGMGIFATVHLTDKSADSEARVQAAFFGKKILDGLSTAVTTNAALNAALTSGSHTGITDADYPDYTARYTVTNMPDGTRKVTVTVTLPS